MHDNIHITVHHTLESSGQLGRSGGGDVSVDRQHVVSRCHSSDPAAVQCVDPDAGPHHTSRGNGIPSHHCPELLCALDDELTAAPTPSAPDTQHNRL